MGCEGVWNVVEPEPPPQPRARGGVRCLIWDALLAEIECGVLPYFALYVTC